MFILENAFFQGSEKIDQKFIHQAKIVTCAMALITWEVSNKKIIPFFQKPIPSDSSKLLDLLRVRAVNSLWRFCTVLCVTPSEANFTIL